MRTKQTPNSIRSEVGTAETERKYTNSIDYWRRKRGFTWEALAKEVPCARSALVRTAKSLTQRVSDGGKLSGTKIERLATVLKVEVWQLWIPAENAESFFT